MTKAVLVKVTAAEHAAIKRRADALGVTMSALVRALATPRGPPEGLTQGATVSTCGCRPQHARSCPPNARDGKAREGKDKLGVTREHEYIRRPSTSIPSRPPGPVWGHVWGRCATVGPCRYAVIAPPESSPTCRWTWPTSSSNWRPPTSFPSSVLAAAMIADTLANRAAPPTPTPPAPSIDDAERVRQDPEYAAWLRAHAAG